MSVTDKRWYLDDTVNKRNLYVLSILKNYCPAYAKHMFEGNRVVEAFYNSSNGGINPLDMPICKVCFKPGVRVQDSAFSKVEEKFDPITGEFVEKINCFCDIHGITYDTMDMRHYLLEEVKLNSSVLLKIEMALYGKV